MLHLISKNSYSTQDWNLMQRAHARASEMLQRCAFTDENANRLARTVMKLFDQGLRDEEVIASRAAEQEKAVCDIADEREMHNGQIIRKE
jgi:hypothetical protein